MFHAYHSVVLFYILTQNLHSYKIQNKDLKILCSKKRIVFFENYSIEYQIDDTKTDDTATSKFTSIIFVAPVPF